VEVPSSGGLHHSFMYVQPCPDSANWSCLFRTSKVNKMLEVFTFKVTLLSHLPLVEALKRSDRGIPKCQWLRTSHIPSTPFCTTIWPYCLELPYIAQQRISACKTSSKELVKVTDWHFTQSQYLAFWLFSWLVDSYIAGIFWLVSWLVDLNITDTLPSTATL
jgi:hypothetical protein